MLAGVVDQLAQLQNVNSICAQDLPRSSSYHTSPSPTKTVTSIPPTHSCLVSFIITQLPLHQPDPINHHPYHQKLQLNSFNGSEPLDWNFQADQFFHLMVHVKAPQ
ncbi:hypothetical protein Fmac_024491 [Flemingia macrophylla]|uniref:Uncharacterized protein n=1 Tax=Flemingia macrophylla TaxID=520843 RepID=A0ABD1LPL9_9FABA